MKILIVVGSLLVFALIALLLWGLKVFIEGYIKSAEDGY
jgi:hypothetical protein